MIVRIDTHLAEPRGFGYTVSVWGEELYSDSGLSSLLSCIAAAVEGFDDEVTAAEFAFRGIVSGTYPLHTLATRPAAVAQHAIDTTTAVYEAEQGAAPREADEG